MTCDYYYAGFFFFFFKQKTAYEIGWCDWSSDVCSSDLRVPLHRTAHEFARRCHGTGRQPTGSRLRATATLERRAVMCHSIRNAASAIACLAIASPAPAQKAAAPASPTLARIKQNGKIRFGYQPDARPFSYRDQSGN